MVRPTVTEVPITYNGNRQEHSMPRTYAITRHPLGVPYGTFAPEHIATVEGIENVLHALEIDAAGVALNTLRESLACTAIGENITRNGPDHRYNIERES